MVELGSESPLTSYEDLLRMMTTAREMLKEALAALENQDVGRANRVIDKDEVVDAYYTQTSTASSTACERIRKTSSGPRASRPSPNTSRGSGTTP